MKAHVADWKTRVYCVRIEPANDSPVIRLAGYPVDLNMSNGQVYRTEGCYEFSGLGATSDLTADSIDLSGVLSAGMVTREALNSGIYDNARVKLFATSFAAPVEDEEPLSEFFFGKVTPVDETYSVELMGKIDVLSQSVGRQFSATCPWTLFDETVDGEVKLPSASRCTGPRSAPDGPSIDDFRVTGTITSVTDQYVVTDTARLEADDWFGEGGIRFITGANAGLKGKEIKSFAAGRIEVHEAFFHLPQVGDQYEMIPGCRHRFKEDCIGKWDNAINFGGQPDVPSPSEYSQVGRGA